MFSIAFPVSANWMKVGESDEMTFYVDFSLAKTKGNFHRIMELMDLKDRDQDGELSLRALVEYDCSEKRSRTLSMSAYGGAMATGMVLFNISDPGEWRRETPGTTGERLLRMLCQP